MPWIRQISNEDATGLLKKQFDGAIRRAGRVWNVVRIMSLNPRTMDTSIKLYGAIMLGRSPLSRIQRELLATVVSAEAACHY